MLINFSVENWLSFRDSVNFSMLASKERQHRERVAKLDKYQLGILPVAAIYGGNASGKTNLFKAIAFAQELIVRGTEPDAFIPVDFFQLDEKAAVQPSYFALELLIEETIYAFSFVVTKERIIEEKLVKISSTKEDVLYERRNGEPNFCKALQKDQFLQFAFQGTRDNQLFLTNSVSQKVDNFRPIYDWFKDTLELVAPDSRFSPFEQFLDEGHPLYATMNAILPKLDTGITHLGREEIPFENLPIPIALRARLKAQLKEGKTIRLLSPFNEPFLASMRGGKLIAEKLVSYHLKSDGTEVTFDIKQESDGTRRIIDLLPVLLDLSMGDAKKVYLIDEIDRSLHTLLTRTLLETYLSKCSEKTRIQLLMTTHDTLLMDQNIFRRDEMWVVERDNNGISHLIAFSEYKDIRYDKDIQKSYLQGRLGGVPKMPMGEIFINPSSIKNKS